MHRPNGHSGFGLVDTWGISRHTAVNRLVMALCGRSCGILVRRHLAQRHTRITAPLARSEVTTVAVRTRNLFAQIRLILADSAAIGECASSAFGADPRQTRAWSERLGAVAHDGVRRLRLAEHPRQFLQRHLEAFHHPKSQHWLPAMELAVAFSDPLSALTDFCVHRRTSPSSQPLFALSFHDWPPGSGWQMARRSATSRPASISKRGDTSPDEVASGRPAILVARILGTVCNLAFGTSGCGRRSLRRRGDALDGQAPSLHGVGRPHPSSRSPPVGRVPVPCRTAELDIRSRSISSPNQPMLPTRPGWATGGWFHS